MPYTCGFLRLVVGNSQNGLKQYRTIPKSKCPRTKSESQPTYWETVPWMIEILAQKFYTFFQSAAVKSCKNRWTSLYARDRDPKNRLAYKNTKDDCKLEDRFQKKAISGSHIHEIADKKTAYNEGRLYLFVLFLRKRLKRLSYSVELQQKDSSAVEWLKS